MEMDIVEAAAALGLILLVAKLGEGLMERLGLPTFAGALLAGLLVGPAVLGLVSHEVLRGLQPLLSLGIVFTLFLAGAEELSNPAMLKVPIRELILSALGFTVSSLAVMALGYFVLGVGLQGSFVLAVAMSIISLGPLTKLALYTEPGLAFTLLRVGLVSEVIGMSLFNYVLRGFSLPLLASTVAVVVAVIVVGRVLLDRVLEGFEKLVHAREAPFAFIVALVIAGSYLAEHVGFNAAVTALLLGMFASEYLAKRPAYLERIRAFTYGFMEPLFFAGVGLWATRISPQPLLLALLLVACHAAPKLFVGRLLGLTGRTPLMLLAKGGIDAAMLLSGLHTGVLADSIYTAAVVAILVSTMASTLSVPRAKVGPELWRKRLRELELEKNIVLYNQPAIYAASIVASKGAVVVVDENLRPRGYIVAEDLVWFGPKELERISAEACSRPEVPVVEANRRLVDVVSDYSLVMAPIIAVVDEEGCVIGTLTPRRLLELVVRGHQREHRR